MKLLIIGHSHTTGLAQAAAELDIDFQVVRLDREIVLATLRREVAGALSRLKGSRVPEEAIRQALGDLDVRTIASVGGNFHNVVGLLRHAKPYDFVVPDFEHLPLRDDFEFVQYDAISDMFYSHLRRLFLGILDIRRIIGYNFVHVDSPPPPESNEYVASNLDEYFLRLHPAGIPELNSPVIRLKHWLVSQSLYEKFCAEARITFLRNTLPRYRRYYLRKAYYGHDATHANAEFSKFYVRSVIHACRYAL